MFQDTVLALQALSDFAKMAFSDTFQMDIAVSAGQFNHEFHINPHNALVLQTSEV